MLTSHQHWTVAPKFFEEAQTKKVGTVTLVACPPPTLEVWIWELDVCGALERGRRVECNLTTGLHQSDVFGIAVDINCTALQGLIAWPWRRQDIMSSPGASTHALFNLRLGWWNVPNQYAYLLSVPAIALEYKGDLDDRLAGRDARKCRTAMNRFPSTAGALSEKARVAVKVREVYCSHRPSLWLVCTMRSFIPSLCQICT